MSERPTVAKGSCLCGAVSLSTTINHHVAACHCNMCRKWECSDNFKGYLSINMSLDYSYNNTFKTPPAFLIQFLPTGKDLLG